MSDQAQIYSSILSCINRDVVYILAHSECVWDELKWLKQLILMRLGSYHQNSSSLINYGTEDTLQAVIPFHPHLNLPQKEWPCLYLVNCLETCIIDCYVHLPLFLMFNSLLVIIYQNAPLVIRCASLFLPRFS